MSIVSMRRYFVYLVLGNADMPSEFSNPCWLAKEVKSFAGDNSYCVLAVYLWLSIIIVCNTMTGNYDRFRGTPFCDCSAWRRWRASRNRQIMLTRKSDQVARSGELCLLQQCFSHWREQLDMVLNQKRSLHFNLIRKLRAAFTRWRTEKKKVITSASALQRARNHYNACSKRVYLAEWRGFVVRSHRKLEDQQVGA